MSPFAQPKIELDQTLASLYAPSAIPDEQITLVGYYPSMVQTLGKKYIYHDIDEMVRAMLSTPGKSDLSKAAYSRSMRLIGAQRLCLCAGPMPFVGFGEAEGGLEDEKMVSQARSLAETNLQVLHAEQRPTLFFFRDVSSVIFDHPNPKLAMRLPADALESLPHVLLPEVHYELLSKRGLALSGLVTPACQLIDLDGDPCSNERVNGSISFENGSPAGAAATEQWAFKAVAHVKTQPLPFVLKLQQTIFGKGTFIVKTEPDRNQLLSILPALLKYNLQCTNESNLHLKAASLIIMEYISCSNPASYAITFFVNRDGSHVFICCAKQDLEEESFWAGASMCYLDQDRLEQHFTKTVCDVSRFLHLRGYYGAVGIDVLEDDFGTQWVVDLNARPPGSMVLGLLKESLSVKRNFHETRLVAAMKCILKKESFMQSLAAEFAEARVIMVGWVDDDVNGVSWMSLVVSGETKSQVGELLARINLLAFGDACYNGQ